MHRSGTSVVTELIVRFGFSAGPYEDLIGSSPLNPRGHFEFRRAVEFDNAVLQRAGGTWDAPPAPQRVEALVGLERPAVQQWFGNYPTWVFKDPRLCLTLPVWIPELAALGVSVVHVLRDPYAVATSVVHRNRLQHPPASRFAVGEMGVAHAIALWAEYNHRACLYVQSNGLRRLTLWYDQLLASPLAETQRLGRFLGVDDRTVEAATACIQPEFRHQPDLRATPATGSSPRSPL
jgi:hypothetical protein